MKIRTAQADGIFTITLDDPPANTYSYEMMRELDDAILAARMDQGIHVIVITGAGEKFFCAGANIGMLKDADPTFKYYFCLHANETLNRLEQTPKLVIAALGKLDAPKSSIERRADGWTAVTGVSTKGPGFAVILFTATGFGVVGGVVPIVPGAVIFDLNIGDGGVRPSLDSLGPFRWQPSPALDWTLKDIAGRDHSLADYRGRPVVVIFFLGNGCLHCAEQLQKFAKAHQEFEDAGLSLIAISSDDAAGLKAGDEIRLIELHNIKVTGVDSRLISAELGSDEIRQSMPKIQWIAKNDIVEYRVMIPKALYVGEEYNTNSLEIARGFAESFVSGLKPDARVQFVRFGFCRIDDGQTAIMTHR